jgi:hypothetical protein
MAPIEMKIWLVAGRLPWKINMGRETLPLVRGVDRWPISQMFYY